MWRGVPGATDRPNRFGSTVVLGDVTGAIVIFVLLCAASGYMYWRAQQNKVDSNNVNDEWDDETNSIIPPSAQDGPRQVPDPTAMT